MPDLKNWIADVKHTEPPALWDEIQRRSTEPPRDPGETRSRPLLAAAILVVTVVVLGAVLYGLARLGDDPVSVSPGPGEVIRYRFDTPPQPLVVGEGAAWVNVGGQNGGTHLWSIDAATGEQRPIEVPGGDWPAVGGGSVWFACNAACDDGAVLQIDPVSGEIVNRLAMRGFVIQMAGSGEGVWVTSESGVSFIDRNGQSRTITSKQYNLVGIDGENLWVSGEGGGVTKIDTATGDVIAQVPFSNVCTMEAAGGMVWVATCNGFAGVSETEDLMGIDAETGEVVFRTTMPNGGQMRFAEDILWVAQDRADRIRILVLDPRSGSQIAEPIEIQRNDARWNQIGLAPPHTFFAIGEGSLWVNDYGAGEVIRMGIPVVDRTDPPPPSVATSIPPTPSPSGGPVDLGLGIPLCDVSPPLAGFDLAGDGSRATAWTGVYTVEGECPTRPKAEYVVAVDVDGDGRADATTYLRACDGCRPYAATDFDGDGADELIVLTQANSTPTYEIYYWLGAGTPRSAGLYSVGLDAPGAPAAGFPANEPIQLTSGGDEGFSAAIDCDGYPDDPTLVVSYADGPVDGATRDVYVTKLKLGGQVEGKAFSIVSTEHTVQPVGDPLPVLQPDRACGVDWAETPLG